MSGCEELQAHDASVFEVTEVLGHRRQDQSTRRGLYGPAPRYPPITALLFPHPWIINDNVEIIKCENWG